MSQKVEDMNNFSEAPSEMEQIKQEPMKYSESMTNEYPEIGLLPSPDVDAVHNNWNESKNNEWQAEFKKLDRVYNRSPSLPDAQLLMDSQRDVANNARAKDVFGRVIVSLNVDKNVDLKLIPISAYRECFPALGLPISNKDPSKRKKHDRAARSDKLEAPRRETMGIAIVNDSIDLDGDFRLKENAGRLLNALLAEYDIGNLTVTDARDGIQAKGNKQWINMICQDRCRRYIVRNLCFNGAMYYDQIKMFLNSCKSLESITLESVKTFLAVQETAEKTTCIIKNVSKKSGYFDIVKLLGRAPNIVSGYTVILLVKNGSKKFNDAVPSYAPSQHRKRMFNLILSKTRWLKVTEDFENRRRCIVQVFDREKTPYPSNIDQLGLNHLSSPFLFCP
ncbi:hypothetical protein CRE_06844 [Caenorhabditis remanei]|uniref:Uncharacterized protein n=1 Tax=Caenorhabditis remanei TaxID=31234 RepID=E3MZJ3_CAERE|nr:hypothetical protein CRE_06844 [Caenorhabditis remanei]